MRRERGKISYEEFLNPNIDLLRDQIAELAQVRAQIKAGGDEETLKERKEWEKYLAREVESLKKEASEIKFAELTRKLNKMTPEQRRNYFLEAVESYRKRNAELARKNAKTEQDEQPVSALRKGAMGTVGALLVAGIGFVAFDQMDNSQKREAVRMAVEMESHDIENGLEGIASVETVKEVNKSLVKFQGSLEIAGFEVKGITLEPGKDYDAAEVNLSADELLGGRVNIKIDFAEGEVDSWKVYEIPAQDISGSLEELVPIMIEMRKASEKKGVE